MNASKVLLCNYAKFIIYFQFLQRVDENVIYTNAWIIEHVLYACVQIV